MKAGESFCLVCPQVAPGDSGLEVQQRGKEGRSPRMGSFGLNPSAISGKLDDCFAR